MTIFTIDGKNNITVYSSQSEISDKDAAPFTSEKELAHLASDWPGTRVVDVWNGISGVTPVRRFTNRSIAIARIWKAIQTLAPAEEKRNVASKLGRAARKPRRKQHAQTAGKNTKQARVIALLKSPSGTTLIHLMRQTGWQAHSVRGFISGALGKKLGLDVESFKNARGERAYRIR